MRSLFRFALCASLTLLAVILVAPVNSALHAWAAPVGQAIALPAPQMTGGMPLMQALANRKTTRAFGDKALSMQQLSNMLWAGFGINRASMTTPAEPAQHRPGRTAPSGLNKQEVRLYVVLDQGAYVYDPVKNQLQPIVSGDLRAKVNAGAAHAAVTIVFVTPKNSQSSEVDTGFIGQNIYLWACL